MNAFLELDFADRQLACKAVRAAMGLDAASIEKDFWVCWTLRDMPDGQCLLLHYPSVFANEAGYIKPVVKIELGARSDD
jgi:hypothetical protein